MRRRGFLIGCIAAAVAAHRVSAQERGNRVVRIGGLFSSPTGDTESVQQLTALQEGLRDLGWIEGRNLTLDIRWFGGDPALMERQADELLAGAPDLLMSRSDPALRALLKRTRTIPIVFVVVADPVGNGLIASLTRPGGNATGFSNAEASLAGKFPELLTEVAPQVRHIAILGHPETLATGTFTPPAEAAARALSRETSFFAIRGPSDVENAIRSAAQRPDTAIVVLPSIIATANRELIIATAAATRVPAIYPFGFYARQGGLISYGLDVPHLIREAAGYANRILRGAVPGDLPVQQPSKFELVINLRTASHLGIVVPQTLQQRADEVIE